MSPDNENERRNFYLIFLFLFFCHGGGGGEKICFLGVLMIKKTVMCFVQNENNKRDNNF